MPGPMFSTCTQPAARLPPLPFPILPIFTLACPSAGGQWVGPTQTLFLDLLQEHGLQLYESYHGLGNIRLTWKNQTSLQPGDRLG